MKTLQLECGNCKTSLSLFLRDASVRSSCPSCRAEIHAEVFPALLRGVPAGGKGEALFSDGESSCFYHPAKKAEVLCDGCGRFLCSLCDIELEGRHLCSTCIEKGVEKGKLEQLQTEITRYDDIALSLSIIPTIFFCPTLFTAPAALFIAIRHWNTPTSVTPRGKWRFVLAAILASLQVLGWGFVGIRILGRLLTG